MPSVFIKRSDVVIDGKELAALRAAAANRDPKALRRQLADAAAYVDKLEARIVELTRPTE